MTSYLEMDEFWITGAYLPKTGSFENGEDWISFAYGPFPDQETCEVRAIDEKAMLKDLGSHVTNYDIDCTDRLSYSAACKHFEETLQSEHFEEWYNRALTM